MVGLVDADFEFVLTTVAGGDLSGEGGFTGGGDFWVEGTFSPGNSAAWVQEAANLNLGSDSNTTMELAGYTALGPSDTEYDVIEMIAAHTLVLDGSLTIELLEGFEPATGSSFDIYRYGSGDRVGEFDIFNSPTWAGGRHFDVTYGDTGVTLTAVPEPGTMVMLGMGALAFLAYAWRRRRRRVH